MCEDLDRVLCQAVAQKHASGELVSSGTRDDPHIIMWAGDGFMARKKTKWVQLSAIVMSTTSLNQSPNDARFVLNYRGGEDVDVLLIRLEDLRPTMQRLAREGKLGDTHSELPEGVGGWMEFALGGDKPWLMTVLGRRNMNHTFFSPCCKCTRENITCMSCDGGQEAHYAFDADDSCRRSHVCPNMWIRGGGFVPFVCPEPGCGKRFDRLADVEAEEELVLSMEPQEHLRFTDNFSHAHSGEHWNVGVLLPAKYVFCDPLHLFLNLFNVAFDESIDFFLQHEYVSSENKSLIAECDAAAADVNLLLSRANIVARFGTSERRCFCGNDLRALMQHETVLPEILERVRPLYERMEPFSFAADAAKARESFRKAEERLIREGEGEWGGKKKKAAAVDADDFNTTAGISRAVAKRVAKQQAAVAKAAAAQQTFQERFDAHVLAMQQAVEGNYKWRVINMLNGLVQLYEYVHQKKWLSDALASDAEASDADAVTLGRGPHVVEAVRVRKLGLMERSREVAVDIVSAVGDARQQTYLHDLVYGVHRVFDVALHPLHAGMQGVEHVNKQMKLILVSQCTAANNNQKTHVGSRLGDVAQAATAIVARSHIVHGPLAPSLPGSQYSLQLQGRMGWGTSHSNERSLKRDHKVFTAGSASGLQALKDGVHSPVARAVHSPGTMEAKLLNPSRRRRPVNRPSRLGPAVDESPVRSSEDCPRNE